MKRILFTLKPHSIVDVITNSSSELFVGKSQSKQEMIELIKEVYPDYLNEYEELQSLNELSNSEFGTYLSYKYSIWSDDLILSKKFSIDPETLYANWGDYGKIEWWFSKLSNEGASLIKQKLDPNNEMYFLYSIDGNPNWEMQEELSNIMTRYHLG